jgi:ATP-dependent Lhr-like helicase
MQWSAPANLERVERGSLAWLRREVVPCSAPQFADFVLRWQQVHPVEQQPGPEELPNALERLQGIALPADLWERVFLPARMPGYQSRWLDEALAGGDWTFVCQGTDGPGPGLLAFFRRDQQRRLPVPTSADAPIISSEEERIVEYLRTRGASFVADIAQDTGQTPQAVRSALWSLVRRSITTNDRFDVIRQGEVRQGPARGEFAGRGLGSLRPAGNYIARHSRPHSLGGRLEGRWSLLVWNLPEIEGQAIQHTWLLLHRYGIVARELALLDPWMTPWRVLYEVLSRLELSGEVRRGYFVEGLSGAQFALPEAADRLQETHAPSTAAAPVVLLHTLDPANLFGSGAPFDIPLLDGGTRALVRRAGNWLIVRAGRPVLLIEGQGKRLTVLSSASREDIVAAVACLPGILAGGQSLAACRKLVVEEWNGQSVTSTVGRELLEAAGFVRDYQGMVLYGPCR